MSRPPGPVPSRMTSTQYPESVTARRDRKKPEERRREILDTALRVADDLGLDRITSRDIASTLRVAPGLVHHYFASVDELVAAAFAHFAEAELQRCRELVEAQPPLPALRAYLMRGLHDPDRPRSARLWMGAWIAAARRPELAAEVDKQMQAGQELLRDLIIRGAEDGAFAPADARISANRILALMDGILVQHSMQGLAPQSFGDVDVLVWETVERELAIPAGTLTEGIDVQAVAAP